MASASMAASLGRASKATPIRRNRRDIRVAGGDLFSRYLGLFPQRLLSPEDHPQQQPRQRDRDGNAKHADQPSPCPRRRHPIAHLLVHQLGVEHPDHDRYGPGQHCNHPRLAKGPIFRLLPVNRTSGTTANESCKLRMTWLRISSW